MYDLKIPLGMMSEILIVRNRLKKDVEKEHITQNQAERFLAEYMLREHAPRCLSQTSERILENNGI